jgi:Protein of unknown function (DUF2949)
METSLQARLIIYLQQELSLSPGAITLVLKQEAPVSLIPVLLWQYGLISLHQLDRLFDWLAIAQGLG